MPKYVTIPTTLDSVNTLETIEPSTFGFTGLVVLLFCNL